eukprot:1150953-Amphidinium_carterae.1
MGNTCCVSTDTAPPESATVGSTYSDEFSAVSSVQIGGGLISEPAEVAQDAQVISPPAAAPPDGPGLELKPEHPPIGASEDAEAQPGNVLAAKPTLPLTVDEVDELGYVEMCIARGSLEDRLGLDLKHCKTHLLVKQ